MGAQLELPLIVELRRPKFVLRESHWSDEQFAAVQAIRGRAGGRARRRANADRDRRIRRLRRDGLSFAAIGRRFDLHRSTVKRICDGREHLIRRPWIRHPDGDAEPSSIPNFGPGGARRLKNWRLGRRFGEASTALHGPGVPQTSHPRIRESNNRVGVSARARERSVPTSRPHGTRYCFECYGDLPKSARACPSCGSTAFSPGRVLHLLRKGVEDADALRPPH